MYVNLLSDKTSIKFCITQRRKFMRLKNAVAVCFALLFLPCLLFSESLFDDSSSNSADASAQAAVKQNTGINISGYIKGGIFAGQDQNEHSILMGNYGELDL